MIDLHGPDPQRPPHGPRPRHQQYSNTIITGIPSFRNRVRTSQGPRAPPSEGASVCGCISVRTWSIASSEIDAAADSNGASEQTRTRITRVCKPAHESHAHVTLTRHVHIMLEHARSCARVRSGGSKIMQSQSSDTRPPYGEHSRDQTAMLSSPMRHISLGERRVSYARAWNTRKFRRRIVHSVISGIGHIITSYADSNSVTKIPDWRNRFACKAHLGRHGRFCCTGHLLGG